MRDYFALLDQPRRPWLDPDELKQAFHQKTLQAHPDAHSHGGNSSAAETAFAQINEAYQVLADSKRRLHHLLTLAETPPPKSAAVPRDIAELFPALAELTHAADALSRKRNASTSPLGLSLLKPELLEAERRLKAQLGALAALEREATSRLKAANKTWRSEEATANAELQELYLRFSYLTRWMSELQEKQTQLLSV